MESYYNKYIKYKTKYIDAKNTESNIYTIINNNFENVDDLQKKAFKYFKYLENVDDTVNKIDYKYPNESSNNYIEKIEGKIYNNSNPIFDLNNVKIFDLSENIPKWKKVDKFVAKSYYNYLYNTGIEEKEYNNNEHSFKLNKYKNKILYNDNNYTDLVISDDSNYMSYHLKNHYNKVKDYNEVKNIIKLLQQYE